MNKSKLRDYPDVGTIRELKITMINVLKSVVENMDNMNEQRGISAERWEI